MHSSNKFLLFFFLSFAALVHSEALRRHYKFFVNETSYTRLCVTKDILTVNGRFPGPTIHAREKDTVWVKVYNNGSNNITIHWHGVKQPRNPWSDGPEYITQCPIQPGDSFNYKLIFSIEVGTLWWHAHSDWSRATVHGAIVVHPRRGMGYPFPRPHQEVPIIISEWWNEDIMEVLEEFVASGGAPRNSDAYTINGQPGDLYPCSSQDYMSYLSTDTFKINVTYGRRYLLRMVNAAMNEIHFVAIANHSLTVVAADASYIKPITVDYVVIAPGQTLDCYFEANQLAGGRYYIAARAYAGTTAIQLDNTMTTAIIQYENSSTTPILPSLPGYFDTTAVYNFTALLRSLEPLLYPIDTYDKRIISTVSLNSFPCQNNSCAGPNGTRQAASMSNISFLLPSIDILDAYYYHISGVFGTIFPRVPPFPFDYTGTNLPLYLRTPERATEVRLIEYNSTIELVFQNTNIFVAFDHPMHLHGYSFYIVGSGLGNFNESTDPLSYNLIDPPLRNTVLVPRGGWAAIRFNAHNPGVWFLHCHLERHLTWGMDTTFIVKEGTRPQDRILPPPRHRPRCI